MRIERIRVGAFGRLCDLDTGPEPLPGLVAVLGPNEAGKSTLFHFLTSMLYGFHPATRDGNPYAPWDGADPSGGVVIRLDGGAHVEVERRLLSQPSGRLLSSGAWEDLRNRALPWAEHVPQAVFRQVFAVTLSELAGLDDETWARVQDRILGAMGASDLRPARHVVAELEDEAARIWRPNRRGNQRVRSLASEVLALRGRRRDAVERDRRLREVVAEAERVRRDLAQARDARHAARLALERVQGLVPIRGQLLRISALREDAGPAEDLRGIPPDPLAELDARDARIKALERRLQEVRNERAEPEAARDAVGDTERKLLARAEAVSAFLARQAALAGDRERHAVLAQEVRDLRSRVETAAGQLLSAPLDEELRRVIRDLPAAELRDRVRRSHAAREERRVREAVGGADRGASPAGIASLVPALAVLASAGALLWVGLAGGGGALPIGAGIAAALLGLALGLAGLRARTGSAHAGATSRADLETEERAAVRAVAELLAGLPLLPALLAEPRDTLATSFERLQDLLRDEQERAHAAGGIQARLDAGEAEAAELASALGRGGGFDAAGLANLVERELRQAQRLAEAAAAGERELRRLAREEQRVGQELAEAKAGREGLASRLAAVGRGDLETGLRTVRERLQARDRAEQLLAELERSHHDLEEIRSRIRAAEEAGESWTREEDDVHRRKASVEDLTLRVEELARRAEALDRDLAHLSDAETVDDIDGEIAALEEEENELLRDRDRRWLLAQLVREADRRFREEHQPDVLRRAGEHLHALTGGRYDHVLVEESATGERFHVAGSGVGAPVPLVLPISRGTLEQAYLALRLAIVDHLDKGVEALPLFLDEVFVDWDGSRRARGVALLGRLTAHRQIFVFTCHDDMADELRTVGARVLRLDGRP